MLISQPPNAPLDNVYLFDGWSVLPLRGLVTRAGTEVHIAPRVMDLLVYLLRRAPRVVSKEELVAEVWQGQAVTDDALAVAVYELRKALGDSARGARWIETVPRRGYRFKGQVELAEQPGPGRPPRVRAAFAAALVVVAVLVVGGGAALAILRDPPTIRPASVSVDQLEALLARGEIFLEVRSAASLRRAEGVFRRALVLDVESAEAWAALARVLTYRADLRLGDRLDLYHRARQAAEKALDIDPEEGQGHLSLGTLIFLLDWDLPLAGEHLARARELEPDDATVHQVSSWWHSATGDHRAARLAAERALELDPASATRHADLAFVRFVAGDTVSALSLADQALVLDPGCDSAVAVKVRTFLARGQPDAAVLALGGSRGDDAETAFWSYVAAWIATLGPDEGLISRAALASQEGRISSAIALLERARERRDWEVLWLEHLPELRGLHGDPRFADLLSRRAAGQRDGRLASVL